MRQVRREADIESALKMQLFVSTVLMTPTLYKLAYAFLPQARPVPTPTPAATCIAA